MLAKLAAAIQNSWQNKGLLSSFLLPISCLYLALSQLHCCLYKWGIRKVEKTGVFTIVVGNIIAGGAGKTPVTCALLQALREKGFSVGVISRGYGRDNTEQALEVRANSTASSVGDEPLLIHLKTQAPVFVAAKRLQAAQMLLQQYPKTQLIICDDGLQHWPMARDYEICVFNEKGLMNARVLPAGPLREPWPRRLNTVLYPDSIGTEQVRAIRKSAHTQVQFWTFTKKLSAVAKNAQGNCLDLAQLGLQRKNSEIIALAGIANPQIFFDMLALHGVAPKRTIALPDHASAAEIQTHLPALSADAIILCTEKDAVKIWPHTPAVYAVALETELAAEFIDHVITKFAQHQGNKAENAAR